MRKVYFVSVHCQPKNAHTYKTNKTKQKERDKESDTQRETYSRAVSHAQELNATSFATVVLYYNSASL